jgi:hypothetical protein
MRAHLSTLNTSWLRRGAVMAAVAACMAPVQAQTASDKALADKVEALSRELAELKAELKARLNAAPAPVAAPAQAAAPVSAPALVNGAEAIAAAPDTVWGGYGEINYNRYRNDRSQDSADLRRLVIGLNHRFDARTQLVTEIEFEHAVTSADDVGEVAIEQAYIERELQGPWALRAGLFLMPSGLLNENHEPTAFYGVERNLVETAIIPSTWREGGVQLLGNLDGGWRVQAGVSTSFDLSKWDSADAEGAESPLGAAHQELAQAKAHDLAAFGAINWRGLPGLQLGGSWFRGGAGQKQDATAGGRLSVTLWDLHARYTPGDWDLSAVYARGSISGTAAFNALSLSSGSDWYPVPERFSGAYVQAAYKLWQHEDYTLKPFARWERVNTREAYADLGQGLTQTTAPTETVRTIGANLDVGSHVVIKTDLQWYKVDPKLNRLGLGLGWSY